MGATILIVLRLVTRGIDLGALIILGRLLSPKDFGVVAIAMSVISIVEAIMELPISIALTTLPTRTKCHYDTAFTLQFLRGLALSLTLLILAWPLSQVYHDGRLIGLICALGLAPASRGLSSPRIVEYSMNFEYVPTFVIEVLGKLVALILSVICAWLTRSYWSLAINTIATPVTMLVVSYLYAPYLPSFSLGAWPDFGRYLRWTTASQAITAFVWQMDQLFLGRFVNAVELGRFSMAANLAILPTQIFVGQIVSPLVVAFSSIRDDIVRLRGAYKKSAGTILAIGLPLMIGMSLNAELILRLVVGQKWLSAAPLLSGLALASVPSFFAGPLTPLAVTLNRTDVFLRLIIVELSIKFPLMLLGLAYWGVMGVVVARMITAVAMAGCAMWLVRHLIGLRFRDQLFAQWRVIVSVGLMALAIYPFEAWSMGSQNIFLLVFHLMSVVGTGALVYLSAMFVLWKATGSPDGLEHDVLAVAVAFGRRFARLVSG